MRFLFFVTALLAEILHQVLYSYGIPLYSAKFDIGVIFVHGAYNCNFCKVYNFQG